MERAETIYKRIINKGTMNKMVRNFMGCQVDAKTLHTSKCLHAFYSVPLLLVVSLSCHVNAFTQDAFTFNNKNSEVVFSGEHAGMPFKGVFKQWDAEVSLPPAAKPHIKANFVVSSAKTGNSTYDSTLPSGDWFDAENYPESQFESTDVKLVGKDYKVSGLLNLRGINQPVTFTLKDQGDRLTASFTIDRLAHKIGMESDPYAEWVSQHIKMTLTLKK